MNLLSIRKNANKTQEQMARDLNVSIRTWTLWEKGQSRIPAYIVQDIARLCSVTPEDILNTLKQQKQA